MEAPSDGRRWTSTDHFQQLIAEVRKHDHPKESPDKEAIENVCLRRAPSVPDGRVKSGTWRVPTDNLRRHLTCGALVGET